MSFATTTHLALSEAGGGRVVLSWRRLHYWHSSYALFGHGLGSCCRLAEGPVLLAGLLLAAIYTAKLGNPGMGSQKAVRHGLLMYYSP